LEYPVFAINRTIFIHVRMVWFEIMESRAKTRLERLTQSFPRWGKLPPG